MGAQHTYRYIQVPAKPEVSMNETQIICWYGDYKNGKTHGEYTYDVPRSITITINNTPGSPCSVGFEYTHPGDTTNTKFSLTVKKSQTITNVNYFKIKETSYPEGYPGGTTKLTLTISKY